MHQSGTSCVRLFYYQSSRTRTRTRPSITNALYIIRCNIHIYNIYLIKNRNF
nr:MAG TPA: hypothetical protein [Herelleviridae sp.]